MGAEARLAELGITLPDALPPFAAYVPAVRAGDLLFLSGQVPFRDGSLPRTGHVGDEVTPEHGAEEARFCVINLLAQVRAAAGSLDRVSRIVKLTVFVSSAPGFIGQPQVGNGASELLVEVFGEAGRHARSAVGVNELPLNAPVEVEAIVELVPTDRPTG
jgi:enamine deaminase RidA (YjgF/YER057c/UK114 family)